jgi:hypothetical protein
MQRLPQKRQKLAPAREKVQAITSTQSTAYASKATHLL